MTKNKKLVLKVKDNAHTHEYCESVNFESIKELVEENRRS